MYLSEFLKNKPYCDISKPKLAKNMGISYASLINLFSGRDVRGSILVQIEQFTDGEVSCLEIYAEFVEKKTKKRSKPRS